LGFIGAFLAVPMVLLVFSIMENFAGTRTVAILMGCTE
jgi:predicted PurR-regulated permease PerM